MANQWKQYKAEQRELGQPASTKGFNEWLEAQKPKPKNKFKPRKKVEVFEAVSVDYINKD